MEEPIKILITDTHSDKENLEVIEEIYEQAFDLADELGIKQIDHLGDAFTNRTGQTLSILLSLQRIAKRAEEREISLLFIPGNHDKTNLESEESYLDLFSEMNSYVKVIRNWNIQIDDVNQCYHCYLPYFKENTVYYKLLQELTNAVEKKLLRNKNWKVFLYTHIAVNGVRNNGGDKVENVLKYNMFKVFTKVFIGHYHNQSRVGKNIFYIGSGMPKDFGEDDKKGFTVLQSEGTHVFIQAKFRKYIKVKIDLSQISSKKELCDLIAKYKNSTDFIRFIFVGTKEEFVQYEKEFDQAKKAGIGLIMEDKNILKAMEAATQGGKIEFNYKLIKRYFLEYCMKNKEQITPERRAIGMKYVDILKDYQ